MPRKNKLTIDAAVAILIEFFDLMTDEIPNYSNPVWDEMSNRCNNAWSGHNWWVNVQYDRRKIYSLAREEMGLKPLVPDLSTNILIPTEDIKTESVNSNNSSSRSTRKTICKKGYSRFNLILSANEWEQIKPLQTANQYSLRPWVWTNVVADAFYRQFRLPCAYTFVRSLIFQPESRYYIKIIGNCKSKLCGNFFKGVVYVKPPDSNSPLRIHVKTCDTRGRPHEVLRRPLNGQKRKEAGKAAITEGCSSLQQRMANETLNLEETDAPIIPSLAVLRLAKKEAVRKFAENCLQKFEDDSILS
ncbi:PREDICTED: uncharacterized protein LOC105567939 [Vollenhovia emeryi]|uniref:uncharacterized protein LOC105567939 n=1 Tax=Vollenhovia emeryi TaxID=411798 RepID=UPI0005F45B3B|nr:PREDICTED: uncharacterized protein LOC105567939 [Vollenhovia emeryi]